MNVLPTAKFGRTGLEVSRLGYGAMDLRDSNGPLDRDAAKRLLQTVLDHGINFIDTSPDYGESEQIIGEALSSRRSEYILATKCGCPLDSSSMDRRLHDYSRANIRGGVERSLRRLRTDYLDLVQIHTSPSRQELESNDSIAELQVLQKEGKVRFIGMSGTLPHLDDHIAMGSFDAFQIPYSVLEPGHDATITRAGEAGAGIIIRGSVWRGISRMRVSASQRLRQLVGRVLGRSSDPWQRANLEELLDGMTVMEFMLRFTLSHAWQRTTIVGTASPKHLAENVKAATKGALPADVYVEVKRRLEAIRNV